MHQDLKNLKIDIETCKQRYLFSDLHEPFFVEFLSVLYQWLKRQAEVSTIQPYQERVTWD